MLFKEELIEKIVKREKTQTRRIVHQGEKLCLVNGIKTVFTPNGRIKWQVGRDYAVQYGRGLPTAIYEPERPKLMKWSFYKELLEVKYPLDDLFKMGYQHLRYTITNIRCEDVRNISKSDGLAEGFLSDKIGFWEIWTELHDDRINKIIQTTEISQVRTILKARPLNIYLAWALTFKIKEA